MGLVKGCEVISVPELSDCFMQVLGELIDEDTEIVTIYYGKDLSEEDCQKEIETAEKAYPDVTFERYEGDQPLYPMFIAAE